MNKYIYITNTKVKGVVETYLDSDLDTTVHFNLKDAIEYGKLVIKESLDRHLKFFDMDEYEENNGIISYTFKIIKVSCNYLGIEDIDEMNKYYYDNLSKINKEDLYDFLLSVLGSVEYDLDLDGNILSTTYNPDSYFDIRSFEYGTKYHLDKYDIGDIVKIKGKDGIFIIYDISNIYESIYNSEDPLYFRQGYMLGNEYNENITENTLLVFDEDIIKIQDYDWIDILSLYKNDADIIINRNHDKFNDTIWEFIHNNIKLNLDTVKRFNDKLNKD